MHVAMKIEVGNMKNPSFFQIGWLWIKGFPGSSLAETKIFSAEAKRMAEKDPRKLIHAMKVGLTITLVSLFYYFQPLYRKDFEVLSSMWTLMTVVALFEFSVGATLGKILNNGLGTLIACGLGLAAHHLAHFTGKTSEPIILGTLVFIQAAATTYVRFSPEVKARYEYGVMVFTATFCLVSVSGFEMDEIAKWVQDRLVTALVGASICVMVSIFVFPVWAGEDLHRLVARNMENLGNVMEDFEAQCFTTSKEGESKNEDSFLGSLDSVLDSKTNLETLANFARWEPGHGQFRYFHPWKQYLKIGNLTIQCACRVDVLLNAYRNSKVIASHFQSSDQFSEIFNTSRVEFGWCQSAESLAPQEVPAATFQEAFSLLSLECGEALKELARSIDTMTKLPSPNHHIANLIIASNSLNFDSWEGWDNPSQIIPFVGVASLLTDIVSDVKTIDEAVSKLGSPATFKCKDINGNSPMKNFECKHDYEPSDCVVSINGETIKHEG